MNRRDFIVNTLVKAGFRTSLKGFSQFCECVETYIESRSHTVENIYSRVASRYRCTKSSVEKNLSRLFECSDATDAIGRLFGISIADCGNKELISVFANYIMLCRDRYVIA